MENHSDQPAAQAGQDKARVPAPERGSPTPDDKESGDQSAEQIEKRDKDDANPLAPPINTGASS